MMDHTQDIRPMTNEERQRAKERMEANQRARKKRAERKEIQERRHERGYSK